MPENAPKAGQKPASDEAFLIAWLVDRDVPCPLCQYNLRGLTSPRCPECGQAIQLAVMLVEPYLKAWIAVVVGLLPPAGFGTFFLIIFAIEMQHRRGTANFFSGITLGGALAMIYIILCIPLSIAALAMRGRFLRLDRPVQHALVMITWVVLLITLFGTISQLR